jgi:predicted GH43/DUF377 family glycosyl hydrolase
MNSSTISCCKGTDPNAITTLYAGNRILKPKREHRWEARAVFNGVAVYHNRLCHMLYRAVAPNLVSTIGYAVSHPWLQAVGWHLSGDPGRA